MDQAQKNKEIIDNSDAVPVKVSSNDFWASYKKKEENKITIIEAVKAGNAEELRKLIQVGGPTAMENAEEAMEKAVEFHDIEACNVLLDAGVNPNVKIPFGGGLTALHVFTDIEYIQKSLNAGANPNIQDDDGNTPLHTRAASSHFGTEEIMQVLINYGADPTLLNNDNQTPEDISRKKFEQYFPLAEENKVVDMLTIAREKKELQKEGPQELPSRRMSRGRL